MTDRYSHHFAAESSTCALSTNAESITSTPSNSVPIMADGAASSIGSSSLPSRYCLGHPNTALALMSFRRATIDTDTPGSNVYLITCCLNSRAYGRWARRVAFAIADRLRQSKRVYRAPATSASGNGRAEPLTLDSDIRHYQENHYLLDQHSHEEIINIVSISGVTMVHF